VTRETIRKGLEWVFSVGGTVALTDGKDGKGEKAITNVAALPNGSVALAKVALETTKLNKPLGDTDLAPLAGLRGVRFLNLQGIPLTNAAFDFLDGWNELEKFHVNGTRVTDAIIPKFARHPALYGFQLRYAADVTGKTFDKLAGLKNLHWLDLEGSGITDEGLAEISQLRTVEELLISGTEVTDAGMAHVAAMRNLKRLHLQDTKVTTVGLASLARLRDLEELSFLAPSLPDYAVAVKQVAAIWPKLRALRFMNGELKAEHIEPLAQLRDLKALDLRNVELGEGGLAALGKLAGLEELTISHCSFGDEQVSGLLSLKKLRSLRLNNSKVTDAGLLKLKPMKALREVEVRMAPVTPAGVATFEKELAMCKVSR
jgi:Leucine-rich repeat (LRR) protein